MSSRFEVMNFQLTAVQPNLSKFWGFPRQIFWGSKIKISKCRSCVRPPRELCVKISWRSVEGRKFTAWVVKPTSEKLSRHSITLYLGQTRYRPGSICNLTTTLKHNASSHQRRHPTKLTKQKNIINLEMRGKA